ncbi:uncharacterized protein LOC116180680 [Photinus pyralis]|uniref:uncharacterized protein LOC116180680 n=1 Tax=Photinus pyralis TaxID=7054 RepID=UPI001266F88D|nr:uncharacterized protein LOC116180680 [Photinus pyralis]
MEVKGEREWKPKELPYFDGAAVDWPIFIGEFERTTPNGKVNTSQNAIRLRKALRGSARESVAALLNEPNNVTKILVQLEREFGRSELVIKSLIRAAEDCKSPDSRPETMIKFATTVLHFVETVKSLREEGYLQDRILLEKLIGKLPFSYAKEWAKYLMYSNQPKNLQTFGNWLEMQKGLLVGICDPVLQSLHQKEKVKRGPTVAEKKSSATPVEVKINELDNSKDCVYCGKSNHTIVKCFKFKNEHLNDRVRFVRQKNLCFRCLDGDHNKKNCSSRHVCDYDGKCKGQHHQLLHGADTQSRRKERCKPAEVVDEAEASNSSAVKSDVSKPLSIVRVKVTGPKGTKRVYALLDSGSDTTMIESSLANSLGITGKVVSHECRGIFGKITKEKTEKVSFEICGNFKAARKYKLTDVLCVTKIGLSSHTQDAAKVKEKFPFLQRAKLESFKGVSPQILIGEDNPSVTAHREILEESMDKPLAKRTLLGWVLAGKTDTNRNVRSSVNLMQLSENEKLDDLIKLSFSLDSFGVYNDTVAGSVEDRRAVKMLEDTVKKVDGKWECGLLWKSDSVSLPESRHEAFSRLLANERRMKRDPEFCKMYHAKLQEYVDKKYITELTTDEADKVTEKTYFIPHFGVFNVNKPGKLRLVFDAAAKNHGNSLNDFLLDGPNLIRPLPSVLMNFRRHNYVINGDIEDMFHRVSMRKEDRDAQRFLWRDTMQNNAAVTTYKMNVLIFGACSSPCSAIYVKNRNAVDFVQQYPEAVRTIHEDMYCDDLLGGQQTIKDCIELRLQLSEINAAGNFRLCKWLSNNEQIMESIPECDRAASVKMFTEKSTMPIERILGLWWDAEKDVFTFSGNFKKVAPEILAGERPTKRQMCSLLMSVFDPLGFVANFKIRGLILLQRTWKSGIDWDEHLPDGIYDDWKSWVDNLQAVVKVTVPRLYVYNIHQATDVQLHTLVDASEDACSAICFLRVVIGEGISVSFLIAKTKVAPLKKLTIPRLELTAAVMGATLADVIGEELRVKINKKTFWSDSKTVLLWIRNESLRYKEFVANRVNRIHMLTNVKDWNWIPTALNVADEGTRMKKEIELSSDSDWLTGPLFLQRPEEYWPKERTGSLEVDEESIEIKKSYTYAAASSWESTSCVDVTRFSSYNRLIRAQCGILNAAKHWKLKAKKQTIKKSPWQLKENAKVPVVKKTETVCEYIRRIKVFLQRNLSTNVRRDIWDQAENLLAGVSQHESFPDEITELEKGTLKRSSKLWPLSPVIENGLVKLNGRIGHADVESTVKKPIILSPSHRFTELLIQDEHEQNAHQGLTTVLNNLRRKFWIIHGTSAVRRVITKCIKCKFAKVKPLQPKMGDLPYYRLAAGNPPFTYTGTDLFGPLEVVVGRHREKRWVMVLTCMVTRAIHLEVVYALSTDETIMALSRFIDQRGRPKHIFSDCGTNFTGAAKVLRESRGSLDWKTIVDNPKFREMKWSFSPPYSPHFGGAWEIMVQQTKRILKATLNDKHPKDQILLTVLKGAENIINSRPLTPMSDDPADPDCLTANHFLRGFADVGMSIPTCSKEIDEWYRESWKKAQFMLETFWRKWKAEALPKLLRREKWLADAEPIKIGEVVLLLDEHAPRNTWKKGIVTKLYPGKDGVIRIVEITYSDGRNRKSFKRGVDKVVPLGFQAENQEDCPDFGGRNVCEDDE